MRTIAYVDGYNLYYGRLRGTPYKWLDVHALLQSILRIQNPAMRLIRVHYFTAPVIARLASHGQASVEAQHAYLRALQSTGVEITFGRHQLEPGQAPRYQSGVTANRQDTVPVWHLDEKETDVRLALTMYRHARLGAMDQAVLVSSDTDLAPALEALRADFSLPLGLILPRRPAGGRPSAVSLMQLADWTRTVILDNELANAQLPPRVPTHRRPADKPAYW
jgi:uncharacterized LabA/DUF88 family protein